MSSVESTEQYGQNAVKTLTVDDFIVDDYGIRLKIKTCTLVLFHGNNEESNNVMKIWALAAAESGLTNLASFNLMTGKTILENFRKLNEEETPLYWARLRGIPFILVYRNTWPVAS